jgi:sensor histidine kinase YesM
MTAHHANRLRLDPASERELDGRMLILTVVFWIAHLAILSSRAATGEFTLSWEASEARLATSMLGVVLCQTMYVLLKRAPADAGLARFAWAAGASAIACVIFALGNVTAFVLLVPMRGPWAWAYNLPDLIETYLYFLVEFTAWSALYATVVGSAQLRDRERRLAQAESAAHQAQLSALRLQIQPHFLFNTLNTLSGLIALGRSAQAEQLILDLSSLMRRTLATAPDQLELLSEEMRAQIMYLTIEQTRFPDRLEVRCEADEACMSALAPSMILQPLVENAVKHGLAPSEGPVSITLGAARRGETLELWVSNCPAPSAAAATPGFGIGLKNVSERLKALFGERARLEQGPDSAGWTSRIILPWLSEG